MDASKAHSFPCAAIFGAVPSGSYKHTEAHVFIRNEEARVANRVGLGEVTILFRVSDDRMASTPLGGPNNPHP
jgi:hypothetical protein